MPHISVSLYPGRDDETKREIAERTQRFFASELGFAEDAVSVSIVELAPDDFVPTIERRYRPEELFVPSRVIAHGAATMAAPTDEDEPADADGPAGARSE